MPVTKVTQPEKRKRQAFQLVFLCVIESDGALNLVGAEASGTSVHMAGGPVNDSLDALHVGLPGAVGAAMRVGHLNAKGDALVAEFAFGHVAYLLAMRIAFQKSFD